MRPTADKGLSEYGSTPDNLSNSACSFEFHKGNAVNRGSSHHRTVLGPLAKPAPSKWDDAQKWLVALSSGGDQSHTKTKPRNSNADDKKLGFPIPQKAKDSCCSTGGTSTDGGWVVNNQDEGETKKIDCNESFWRINKPFEDSLPAVRSVCVRDMGTEMTPIASQEPSRTATPLRATTPLANSPISSRSSTPGRCQQGAQAIESYQSGLNTLESRREAMLFRRPGETRWSTREEEESDARKILENNNLGRAGKSSSLEARALAWDEAERAKYMARYKREEVKIQAWENYQKRKAETEMRRMERAVLAQDPAIPARCERLEMNRMGPAKQPRELVKGDRLKSRAQERLTNKLAATHRRAEEKRANAEAKLNEQAVRTSERADFIRRTDFETMFKEGCILR